MAGRKVNKNLWIAPNDITKNTNTLNSMRAEHADVVWAALNCNIHALSMDSKSLCLDSKNTLHCN